MGQVGRLFDKTCARYFVVGGARSFAEEGSFTGGVMVLLRWCLLWLDSTAETGRYIAHMKFLVMHDQCELRRLRRALRDAALKTERQMTWGSRISARHVKAKNSNGACSFNKRMVSR